MNQRNILPTLTLALILAVSAAAQMTVTGEVVEIIDGKTVVILIPAGKVKAELQYIDVPETGQELHDTVVEHLRTMLLGKIVEYRAQTIFKDRTVGRMLLNGIDVSQQLLRDGAAWYALRETGAQNQVEREAYLSTEKLAKSESRGIWEFPDLKPALEFRSDQAKILAAKSQPTTQTDATTNRAPSRSGVGLTQFDINTTDLSRKTSWASENVVYGVNVTESERIAIGRSMDAFESMRTFLIALESEGMSLNEYEIRLGRLQREVNSAIKDLARGNLKLSMQENLSILQDLGMVFERVNKNGYVRYKGSEEFAKKYHIEPVQINSGTYVLWRRDIVNALYSKVVRNHSEIKEYLQNLAKYAK